MRQERCQQLPRLLLMVEASRLNQGNGFCQGAALSRNEARS
jgi:hypothetical protein